MVIFTERILIVFINADELISMVDEKLNLIFEAFRRDVVSPSMTHVCVSASLGIEWIGQTW
jgi:hypothetical protein